MWPWNEIIIIIFLEGHPKIKICVKIQKKGKATMKRQPRKACRLSSILLRLAQDQYCMITLRSVPEAGRQAWQNKIKPDKAKENKTGQYKPRQGKANENKVFKPKK